MILEEEVGKQNVRSMCHLLVVCERVLQERGMLIEEMVQLKTEMKEIRKKYARYF